MESENIGNSRWRGRLYRYAPFLFWTAMILYMSSPQASMSETSRFIIPMLEFVFPNASPETLLTYHFYIRKSAHFFEYAVLGFLASRAFWKSGNRYLRNYWFIIAVGFVVLVASIDEINQSFNITRTSSVYDVILDGIGGLSMVIFLCALKKLRNN